MRLILLLSELPFRARHGRGRSRRLANANARGAEEARSTTSRVRLYLRSRAAQAVWLAGSEIGSPQKRARLVLRLLPFGLRIGIGHDARGGLHVKPAGFDHRGADGDGDIHVAVEAEVADRAAVDAAFHWLEFVDQLHRAHLRRAGDRAGGEARSEHI